MNAGADVMWQFHRHFGVGGGTKFSRASVEFTSADGEQVSVDAGGLRLLAGLRARF